MGKAEIVGGGMPSLDDYSDGKVRLTRCARSFLYIDT